MQLTTAKMAILALFILCALPVGVMFTVLTPPGQANDEETHLIRAAGLLHGAIFGVRKPGTDPMTGQPILVAGVKCNPMVPLYVYFGTATVAGRPVVTAQTYRAGMALTSYHANNFWIIPTTVTYPPETYLPASLGLAIGIGLGLPAHSCFLLARLFMLAAFLGLGAAALILAAYGEAIILTALLLPITLFDAGSVNQDGVLIGMVCLACAALSRPTRRRRWLAALLLALLVCSKQPYAPLLALLALPLYEAGLWQRLRLALLALLPALLWTGLALAFVSTPASFQPYHAGPLYRGDHIAWLDHGNAIANLHILLQAPALLVTLPWQSLCLSGAGLYHSMIFQLGYALNDVPSWYITLWSLSLLLSLISLFLARRHESGHPPARVKTLAFVLLLLLASVWLLCIGMYVMMTRVGDDHIYGLQGRYLIIYLPALILSAPAAWAGWRLPAWVPYLPIAALGIFDLGYLPALLVNGYYLH
jgi:uncharacterized membrane protein